MLLLWYSPISMFNSCHNRPWLEACHTTPWNTCSELSRISSWIVRHKSWKLAHGSEHMSYSTLQSTHVLPIQLELDTKDMFNKEMQSHLLINSGQKIERFSKPASVVEYGFCGKRGLEMTLPQIHKGKKLRVTAFYASKGHGELPWNGCREVNTLGLMISVKAPH